VKNGPEQLKDWMHRRRFMQKEAAEYLGWDETYVSRILTGGRIPGLDNAIHLERMTGIPVEVWASSELDIREDPVTASRSKR
jgi:transcriptional regulator with XRE-family HTH domain